MNFRGLDQVAFFVARHLRPEAVPFVASQAWAFAVRTGFPDYVEVWGQRR